MSLVPRRHRTVLGSLAIALVTLTLAAPAHAALQATFTDAGLETLTYNGVKLLDARADSRDRFRVYGYRVTTGGVTRNVLEWTSKPSITGDGGARRVRWSYDWGFVEATYTVGTDRLDVDV